MRPRAGRARVRDADLGRLAARHRAQLRALRRGVGGPVPVDRVPLLDQGEQHARDRAHAAGGRRPLRLHRRGGVRDRPPGRRRPEALHHQRQRQEPDHAAPGRRARRTADQRRLDRRGPAPQRRRGRRGLGRRLRRAAAAGLRGPDRPRPELRVDPEDLGGQVRHQRRQRRGRSRDRLRPRRARSAVRRPAPPPRLLGRGGRLLDRDRDRPPPRRDDRDLPLREADRVGARRHRGAHRLRRRLRLRQRHLHGLARATSATASCTRCRPSTSTSTPSPGRSARRSPRTSCRPCSSRPAATRWRRTSCC